MTDAYDGLDPAGLAVDPTTSIPTPSAMPGWPGGSTIAMSELPELGTHLGDRAGHAESRSGSWQRATQSAATRRLRLTAGFRSHRGGTTTMTTPEIGLGGDRPNRHLQSLAAPGRGPLALAADWDKFRDVVDSARSPELNRAEREGHAAGYYEGLIGGGTAPTSRAATRRYG